MHLSTRTGRLAAALFAGTLALAACEEVEDAVDDIDDDTEEVDEEEATEDEVDESVVDVLTEHVVVDDDLAPPDAEEGEEVDPDEAADEGEPEPGGFDQLVDAIETAGLDEELSDEGPYTVFAPVNFAFDLVPEDTLDDLLEDEERLREVLEFHIVEDELRADDLSDGDTVTTMSGEELTITVTEVGAELDDLTEDGADTGADDNDNGLDDNDNGLDEDNEATEGEVEIRVDAAEVTETDIEADNGVIHAISAVLLPPVDDTTDTEADEGAVDEDNGAVDDDGAVEDGGAVDEDDELDDDDLGDDDDVDDDETDLDADDDMDDEEDDA